MNLDNLGSSIANHRKSMNLTQEKLAEHLDVSTHYIYEIEKCGKTPSFPMMIKIADLFHTTIDSLLSESTVKNSNNESELIQLINSLSPEKQNKLCEYLKCALPYLKL